MEWFNFEIKEVWQISDSCLRGTVLFHFETASPDRSKESVRPSVEVTAFINHDASASYESTEQALLSEAHRLLSEAVKRSAETTPQAIRSQAHLDGQNRERRWQEESDAAMAEALKDIAG